MCDWSINPCCLSTFLVKKQLVSAALQHSDLSEATVWQRVAVIQSIGHREPPSSSSSYLPSSLRRSSTRRRTMKQDLPLSLLSRGRGQFVSSNGHEGRRDGRLDVCFTPQVSTKAVPPIRSVSLSRKTFTKKKKKKNWIIPQWENVFYYISK